MVIYKKEVVESANIKDKEHKIYDSTYLKSIYIFGYKIAEWTTISNQNDIEVKINTVGFGNTLTKGFQANPPVDANKAI
jgi:hypothetical protein